MPRIDRLPGEFPAGPGRKAGCRVGGQAAGDHGRDAGRVSVGREVGDIPLP